MKGFIEIKEVLKDKKNEVVTDTLINLECITSVQKCGTRAILFSPLKNDYFVSSESYEEIVEKIKLAEQAVWGQNE